MPGCAHAVKTGYVGKNFHGHSLIISKASAGGRIVVTSTDSGCPSYPEWTTLLWT